MTTPTDDDREAAESIVRDWDFSTSIRESLSIAFAAHRLLGQRQGIEMAAKEVEAWFPGERINEPRFSAGDALRKAIRNLAPGQGVEAKGWQDIASAPRDGAAIQARIWANGEDNIIAWQHEALLDSNGNWCGAWCFVTDQEPPACWTDGWCWEVNEDGEPSAKPTHWKPAPEAEQ